MAKQFFTPNQLQRRRHADKARELRRQLAQQELIDKQKAEDQVYKNGPLPEDDEPPPAAA